MPRRSEQTSQGADRSVSPIHPEDPVGAWAIAVDVFPPAVGDFCHGAIMSHGAERSASDSRLRSSARTPTPHTGLRPRGDTC